MLIITEITEQGHHPDLLISYGQCVVEIWTHKINGLAESDFILAAKIDDINNEVTVRKSILDFVYFLYH